MNDNLSRKARRAKWELPLVVANLKANLTWDKVSAWLDEVGPRAKKFSGTVVFCPSAPFIAACHEELENYNSPIRLGAQDISKFEQGAYTGEVAASQIKDLCQYAIIGHSERRQNFGEDDETLAKKAKNAIAANLEPIFCVQSKDNKIPNGVSIVAYEPVFAIGTGNPDTPENVKSMTEKIEEKGDLVVLYGGSVTPDNAKSFLKKGQAQGLLVGATSSLNPETFVRILESI